MQTDPLGDFLTQIRNANRASKAEMASHYSKMKGSVARVLKDEGYIRDFSLDKRDDKQVLVLQLKTQGKQKAIKGIRRISKPGLRHYVNSREIPRVLGGLGVSILSTSKGVMSGHEAKKQNMGGEVLAYVW
ncbi:MAG: 30S ribosomal protein S8 [Verrucomicrobiota bacterium]